MDSRATPTAIPFIFFRVWHVGRGGKQGDDYDEVKMDGDAHQDRNSDIPFYPVGGEDVGVEDVRPAGVRNETCVVAEQPEEGVGLQAQEREIRPGKRRPEHKDDRRC